MRITLIENFRAVFYAPYYAALALEREPGAGLAAFCEVVGRDPFFLVGRAPNPAFRLQDQADRKLAAVSEVPTPWMCLQHDLRRAGIDASAIRRAPARTMEENVAAHDAGALAPAVAGYFPGIPPATLSACCRDYLALGLWNRDPVVQREGLLWLRDAALGAGLIRKRYSYFVLVFLAILASPDRKSIAPDWIRGRGRLGRSIKQGCGMRIESRITGC